MYRSTDYRLSFEILPGKENKLDMSSTSNDISATNTVDPEPDVDAVLNVPLPAASSHNIHIFGIKLYPRFQILSI